MQRTVLALSLALMAGASVAAPIYRCGRTYSQVPCPEGTIVEATDPRSAAQRAEARRLAAAQRKAAADLERERKAQEKAAQTAPGSLSAAPAASTAASAPHGRVKPRRSTGAGPRAGDKQGDFVATVPRDKAPRK
jgi:hypothetical protein